MRIRGQRSHRRRPTVRPLTQAGFAREVHLAHPSGTDQRDHFVRSECRTGHVIGRIIRGSDGRGPDACASGDWSEQWRASGTAHETESGQLSVTAIALSRNTSQLSAPGSPSGRKARSNRGHATVHQPRRRRRRGGDPALIQPRRNELAAEHVGRNRLVMFGLPTAKRSSRRIRTKRSGAIAWAVVVSQRAAAKAGTRGLFGWTRPIV